MLGKLFHRIGIASLGGERYRRVALWCYHSWAAVRCREATMVYEKSTGELQGVVDGSTLTFEDSEFVYKPSSINRYKRIAMWSVLTLLLATVWQAGWQVRLHSTERLNDQGEMVLDKVRTWEFFGTEWSTIDITTLTAAERRTALMIELFPPEDLAKLKASGKTIHPLKRGGGVDRSKTIEVPGIGRPKELQFLLCKNFHPS